MMAEAAGVPEAALWIWAATLLVVALVIVPLAVRLLRGTLAAARAIEGYLAEMRAAGAGIATNTGAIPALDRTIETAGLMGDVAGRLERHSGAVAGILAERAGGGR